MQDFNEKYHKFMSMEAEKRDRIINAAMKQFNEGYKKASTDLIVKDAGISKGLLFHYFGTKENLYEFILGYSVDVVIREYFELINFEQRDILERLWQTLLLKIDLSYKYPLMFDFLTTAYKDKENTKITDVYAKVFAEAVPKLFADVDVTLFKKGIDPQKAINIFYWTQVGYSNSQLERINSTNIEDFQEQYDVFLDELKGYFDIFRGSFYEAGE
ncbi:MAG: TetR/AcrR family transcriptional regulator [Oscillospiraceae bacterium]|nr:TetR/AcrR family transcriptional regulator [Oscillospiraceae bacterium]